MISAKNTSVILSSLLMGGGAVNAAYAQERPNIVFIYADDLGYGDLACYGSKVNRTPNIDQLAQDGIRFTDFYSAASVSSPSRAALLTGRYPVRSGVNSVFVPDSYTGLPASEITIAEALQQQGYHTGIVGKWHLGHRQQFLPLQNGFNESFGTPYSNGMISVAYMRGNEVEDFHVNQDSITYTYTREAICFIEKNRSKPFFLYLAHNMPHVPLAASANFKGKSANGLYGDVIEELDWSVGEVMKKLAELGLDEKTIVVFASDNGPWTTQGPLGGVATPLFHGKSTSWEGGQRVPSIVRWKKHIAPKQINIDVAAMIDWFPTFIRLAGGKIPADKIIDGKDISNVLLGKGKRENQNFVYMHRGQVEAYRSGDWKIILPAALRKGNVWQPGVPAHDTVLFNLRTDVGETHDVKSQNPDIAKRMVAELSAFTATLKDCPPSMVVQDNSSEIILKKQREEVLVNRK